MRLSNYFFWPMQAVQNKISYFSKKLNVVRLRYINIMEN